MKKNIKNQHLILKNLRLQNFATFTNQEINFEEGLNAIIGETGSGKSLVMDALALVLGERADKKIVRAGHEFSTVEAKFYTANEQTKKYLDELGHPVDQDEIIIRRVIYQEGKSKNFLNLQQCSLQTLQSFTREYIDLVGQFENQKLLSATYQLELLDESIGDFVEKKMYQGQFKKYQEVKSRFQSLVAQEQNRLQQIDFLKFQLDEVLQLQPSQEEEEKLLLLKENLGNQEQKIKIFNQLRQYLEGSDALTGILELIDTAAGLYQKNKNIGSALLDDKFSSAQAALHELFQELGKFQPVEMPEEEISQMIDKLDRYQKIKRKYGGSIEGVTAQIQLYAAELKSLEQFEDESQSLIRIIDDMEKELLLLAQKMNSKRILAAKKLSESLSSQIQELNMKGAFVKISIASIEALSFSGKDELVFMVQTNPGEGMHLLGNVASGGELSRILLCLRQLSSSAGKISIFLFDEVDTGIGGETGLLLGKHLSQLSKRIQVLAITHLPQIAFNADQLIKVEKLVEKEKNKDRTISKVTQYTSKKDVQAQAQAMVPLHH